MTYTPDWPSVNQHVAAPEWFQDAKFGIYHHWGAFGVPAFSNEWYPREMYMPDSPVHAHHIEKYGEPAAWPYHFFIEGGRDKSGRYVEFAPKLKSAGGGFDPREWAQLIADAGARFAGPVAEHHDGFSMWNSKVNEWNSVDKGPRLNLLELFADAYREQGLKLLVAMHHAFHFTGFYDHVPPQSTHTLRKLYGQLGAAAENELWLAKIKEVVDLAKPDIIYQDVNLDKIDESAGLEFLAYYYNQAIAWGTEVVATYKDGFNNKGEVFDYERGGPADLTSPYWLTDDILSTSTWSYTTEIEYFSLAQILHSLIDRVSKNGNMLLNISPMADGSIPAVQRELLSGIGDYLRRFGESIYATRAWTVYGEGPTAMGGGSFTPPVAGTSGDIRFTRSKDGTILYATALAWPARTLTITTLATGRTDLTAVAAVQLMGPRADDRVPLTDYRQDEQGLHITVPETAPFAAPAYVFKFVFSGPVPAPRPALAP